MLLYDLFGSPKEKLEVENTKSSRERTVVEWKTCLQSSEELPAVNTVRTANAVCSNADSQHLSPLTRESSACILQFALFLFILYTTVILIASFAPVFNGNICVGKQDDGCVALKALADIQGLFPAPGANGVVWRSSKLEAERFKLGWMAGWEQSEDKDILNCKAGQSEKYKATCGKHPSRQGNVSKHFLEILARCQPPLSVPNVKTMLTAARVVHTNWVFYHIVSKNTLVVCYYTVMDGLVMKAAAHPLSRPREQIILEQKPL